MLNAIINFSLRFRTVVIALACALLAYGYYSYTRIRYDVFPEFAPPQVQIQTEASGLSPEQVEVLITQPIENSVNGVPGLESLRSNSIQGLSVVTIVFREGSDVYLDRQVVAEHLATLSRQLPGGATPVIAPLTSSTGIVLILGLTSDKQSMMTLRTVADWTVRQRLLAVPGVSKIAVFGGDVKQFQIQFLPEKLVQHNLSLDQLLTAARQATGIRGAGFISTVNQNLVLETEGQSASAEQLAHTVLLHQNGANVTLADVATVREAPAPAIGAATVMNKPAVILMISTQYGANTIEVTRALDTALNELRPTLERQGIAVHADIFRPADFIQRALHNLRTSLIIGAVLIVGVLFLFLFNLRNAAISCAAIPLSLITAVIVLERLGFSFNTMTLGGLAIAIGEVVDDAVIDIENIYRRLRENRVAENPRPVLQVVVDASIEVRHAVIYATFAVILVFIPVLSISGVAGRIFAPLGFAYILAITASLLVALTVTPALSLLLLANRDLPPQDPPVIHWLKDRYRSLLLEVERIPRLVIGAVALAVVIAVVTLFFLETSFLPDLREGHFIVHMRAAPGTSIEQSLHLGKQVTDLLLKNPSVRLVAQRVGRAELSEDVVGTYSSEIEVDLKDSSKQAENVQTEVRNELRNFPGATFSANTFLTERIDETLSGYTAPVVVTVVGNDLDELDQQAARIADALGQVQGATEVQVQSPPGMPEITVRLRDHDVIRWGFDPVDVLEAVRTAFSGDVAGQVYQGNQVFDVNVILAPEDRSRVADIGGLPLRNPAGIYLPLRQLADIYEASGRYIVLHEGARRVQTITCNVTGRSVPSFVADAKNRIDRLALPAGSYVEFAGTTAAQAQSQRDLLVHSFLAGFGIVLLLAIVMGNYRNLLLVLANIPFAFVGGVVAAFLTGGTLSLGSLVGFVTLFGITIRNSIMMISHYENLVEAEGMTWGPEAAMQGASERLAPILMTALVTGLGLLPLALGSGAPGREVEGPLAIVILGGLVTSTALNLLVLPTLALRYGKFEKRRMELLKPIDH